MCYPGQNGYVQRGGLVQDNLDLSEFGFNPEQIELET